MNETSLTQTIENIRTMQQSYDALASAAEAYNVGKTELAAAITAKGVATDPTETYPEMADKVTQIVQTQQVIDGGDMYAKQLFGSLTTPNYWNLYEIMAQLLSDGRLVNYGGILLAEYYKGYDSLALSGAGAGGAYVVSDKDSDGDFIMYTNDTTHTWNTEDDGKGNRWVAYCFADEYHDFQITDTNTSPRSIFIGRKVGNITSLVAGRASQIVVPDGSSLRSFSGAFQQNFNSKTTIRVEKAVSNTLHNPQAVECLYLETDELNGNPVISAPTGASTPLRTIIANVRRFNGTLLNCAYNGASNVSNIIVNGIEDGDGILFGGYLGQLPSLKTISILADHVRLSLTSSSGITATNFGTLYLGYLNADNKESVTISKEAGTIPIYEQIQDVELMQDWCKNLSISVLTGLTEDNMYAHILQRLKQDEPDCGDGVTITLGSTNLAKLTSEESVQLLDDLTNIYGYTFA